MSHPTDKHPCDLGDGEIEHDMRHHTDVEGEGAWATSYGWWECEKCGEIDSGSEPPDHEEGF